MGPTDEPRSGAPEDPTPAVPATTEADSKPVEESPPESESAAASPLSSEPVAKSETTEAPEPWSSASSSPAAEPEAATDPKDPAIASTVSIPADEPSEGGEWELLTGKVKEWMANNKLNELWDKTQTPAKLIGGLVFAIVVLQIYSGILNTIDKLPLAPRLLELAGVIWLGRFAIQNLVRNSDRKRVFDGLRNLWNKVIGS